MKKKTFIQIAKSLGIVIPACLLVSTVEANAANLPSNGKKNDVLKSGVESNLIKDRIIKCYNLENQESPYQIAHTNVHANYRISHTNVHTDFYTGNRYTDSHSDTPQKHVNDHSNSAV